MIQSLEHTLYTVPVPSEGWYSQLNIPSTQYQSLHRVDTVSWTYPLHSTSPFRGLIQSLEHTLYTVPVPSEGWYSHLNIPTTQYQSLQRVDTVTWTYPLHSTSPFRGLIQSVEHTLYTVPVPSEGWYSHLNIPSTQYQSLQRVDTVTWTCPLHSTSPFTGLIQSVEHTLYTVPVPSEGWYSHLNIPSTQYQSLQSVDTVSWTYPLHSTSPFRGLIQSVEHTLYTVPVPSEGWYSHLNIPTTQYQSLQRVDTVSWTYPLHSTSPSTKYQSLQRVDTVTWTYPLHSTSPFRGLIQSVEHTLYTVPVPLHSTSPFRGLIQSLEHTHYTVPVPLEGWYSQLNIPSTQ